MDENEIAIFSRMMILPGLLMVGGFFVVVATILRGAKVAELRHRERMAMIERGMVPPEPAEAVTGPRRSQSVRLTIGIILCGLGLALGMLIAFAAGEPGVALGVGGAIVMLGLAFVASAFVPQPGREAAAPPMMPPAPPPEI